MSRASSVTSGSLPVGDNGKTIPVLPSGASQSITAAASSAQTGSDFGANTKIITIEAPADTGIHFALGADPVTATTSDAHLAAGTSRDEPIFANDDRIACIVEAGGSTGSAIYITERAR